MGVTHKHREKRGHTMQHTEENNLENNENNNESSKELEEMSLLEEVTETHETNTLFEVSKHEGLQAKILPPDPGRSELSLCLPPLVTPPHLPPLATPDRKILKKSCLLTLR